MTGASGDRAVAVSGLAAEEGAASPRAVAGERHATTSRGDALHGRDPYLVPAFPLRDRLARALWGLAHLLLVRWTPRPMHGWRRLVLVAFGARLARGCHIYPRAEIWAPWNLECGPQATIADGAVVYNPSPVRLGSHAIVSQHGYLCGATHDCDDPAFPLVSAPITLGDYAWVCARATVQPGVTLGDGAVLALGAVATRDLEPWTVYAGVPARRLKPRARPPVTAGKEDRRP
jgi:putative colanic acid biosynthesis acetyltransferase WcaF